MESTPNAFINLIKNHMLHLEKNYLLHYYVGDQLEIIERFWLGIPMIVLSAISAGTSLQFFEPSTSNWLKYVPILCSIIASILAGLMTFLNLRDKSLLHQSAAANYYRLLNHCKAFLADPEIIDLQLTKVKHYEDELITKIYELDRDCPSIPGWAYSNVGKLIDKYRGLNTKVSDMQNAKS